nr:MAG TPA: hypothetical protein [Caudoviricetes sp.]
MDNYIVINGKKAEITEEQLKALGIEDGLERKSPFGKIADNGYYYITNTDVINFTQNIDTIIDEDMYNSVNYFNDEDFANQVMLHQKLYRKLLKYAYDNDAISDWANLYGKKYFITKSIRDNKLDVGWAITFKHNCVVYFNSEEVTKQAIEDVVKPFMKKYPEFVW